jgi:hypothetical protein
MKTKLTPDEQRQNGRIAWHYKSLGISVTKIEQHPCVADIRTLMDFDSYHVWMTEKDKQIYAHAWQWVYTKELPLNTYLKRKLASILDNIEYRQQRYQHIKLRQLKRANK